MQLDLYYFKECPFCVRVLDKMEDLGLADFITLKNTRENSSFQSFHVKTTGRYTVPCLYIDNQPMFESLDICQWLEKNQSIIKGK